ncbi:MAG: NADH-quinone oxidoreductase subunit NuoH [Planctomycetes bacterium]|nr:NADH-quinone oxidoreductase subunit NuoH [Planctomycetota bacterium]
MSVLLAEASFRSFLEESVGVSEGVALLLAAFVHAFLLINFFAVAPLVFIWLERKVAGRIQDRLGPTRVGGRFGWLQGLADGAKLVQKEDLVPKDADSMLFRMAPYLVCIASFGAFIFLPFSDGWVAVAADVGLFILLAILSLEVFGIILAGYSSGSKWSLYGGMREAAQMVSYEIPLAICALVPIVAVGSLNLGEIGAFQSGWFINWLIFHDPFTFVAFFVFFTVATASCKRAPFDLAEAESELVGGFHTEYSGMRWSYFFMAEYASMFLVSAVAAYLFLGGWHTGIGPIDGWLLGLRHTGATSSSFSFGSYAANLFGMFVILSKGSLLVFVQIWVRWTLPRLRIDQVMTTCLKYLIPISCFLFLGAVAWPLILVQMTGRTTLPFYSPLGERQPVGQKSGASKSSESKETGGLDQRGESSRSVVRGSTPDRESKRSREDLAAAALKNPGAYAPRLAHGSPVTHGSPGRRKEAGR